MTDTGLHQLQKSYSHIEVFLFAQGENDRGRPNTAQIIISVPSINFAWSDGDFKKSASIIFRLSSIIFRLQRKTGAQHFFGLRRKKLRAKSRVALDTTSLAAAVAQNGYFDTNVAPAQQRNS